MNYWKREDEDENIIRFLYAVVKIKTVTKFETIFQFFNLPISSLLRKNFNQNGYHSTTLIKKVIVLYVNFNFIINNIL